MRGNTIPDLSESGSFAWMSQTLCTMILYYSERLWWTVSRLRNQGETWTNVVVQWQDITCCNLQRSWPLQPIGNSHQQNVIMSSTMTP